MSLKQLTERMKMSFEAIGRCGFDGFIDTNFVFPPSRKGRNGYGAIHQYYTSLRDANELSETGQPEKCIEAVKYTVGISSAYITYLERLLMGRSLLIPQVVRELKRAEDAYKGFARVCEIDSRKFRSSEIRRHLKELINYQLAYTQKVNQTVGFVSNQGRVLTPDNYVFWRCVESAYKEFMQEKGVHVDAMTGEEVADEPLICFAFLNSIVEERKSVIYSQDGGVADEVEMLFNSPIMDGVRERLSSESNSVSVYRINCHGDLVKSTDTAGLAKGDPEIARQRERRKESRRLRAEGLE